MKKNPKPTGQKRNVIVFEAEDTAVIDILSRAEKQGRGVKTRMINEALRRHGDDATLKILARDIMIAEDKLKEAQEAILRRK